MESYTNSIYLFPSEAQKPRLIESRGLFYLKKLLYKHRIAKTEETVTFIDGMLIS